MMAERLTALRTALEAAEGDTFFSVFPPDNQYLTGFLTSFEEISAGIIITADTAHFFTDSRFTEQAHEEVTGYEIEQTKGDLLKHCGAALKDSGAKRVVLDPAGLTVDEFDRLAQEFGGELVKKPDIVANLRAVKSSEEIDAVRAASNLAEGVMLDLVEDLAAGLPEQELAAQFEFEFKKRGAAGTSFDTIALYGPRSSLPHGHPGATPLAKGDAVLLDFGCRLRGYCSDLTRTFAFDTIPPAPFEEVYNLTLDAQLAALDAVRPGAICKDVDAVARDAIKAGGYGDYFGHGLGHGVGVQIHEQPRVNPRSGTVLEPGMVITIEPGIYVPGKGGVRIEDLVVVTETGCDILTTSSKALRVLSA